MHRTSRIAIVIFLLIVFAACGRLALSQPSPQMLVTTDWLAVHINDANLVILDITNDPGAYSAGHIPGARILALRDIAVPTPGGWLALPAVADLKAKFEQSGVDDRSRIVLYGDNKGLFAARAYFTLDYLGLGNRAALLDGGLEEWKLEHRAISSDAVAHETSRLTVHPNPGIIADLSTVSQIVLNRTAPIVDARAPAEFAGTKGGVGAARTGHIPGAKNVFWVDNLAGTDIPTLKPVAAIRAHYVAVGLKPGTRVIVYCHAGMRRPSITSHSNSPASSRYSTQDRSPSGLRLLAPRLKRRATDP